jgi:multisubunit Na+/H+ antiporter MnhB subunit
MQADIRNRIRIFMLFETATFAVASLIHAGVPVKGYEHHEARLAEAVIATVLLGSLVVTWIRPVWTRAAGLGGQGFALVGTLVGLFTIAVGVGPRTAPDVAYHVAIVVVLAWGLRLAWRARRPAP